MVAPIPMQAHQMVCLKECKMEPKTLQPYHQNMLDTLTTSDNPEPDTAENRAGLVNQKVNLL